MYQAAYAELDVIDGRLDGRLLTPAGDLLEEFAVPVSEGE
jgi:hypothetical protein